MVIVIRTFMGNFKMRKVARTRVIFENIRNISSKEFS